MSAEPATPVKETKAQRAERLKRQKNPWECFEEIRRFALGGHATIPDEWLKTYLRWWGVYTQGDGAGAIGGSGGEGKSTPYFMLRIRLSSGFINARQLRAVAGLAEKFAGGIADISNEMGAFTVVRAASHEAAAKMFLNHPHFTVFPGDSVEIMECLPIPSAA